MSTFRCPRCGHVDVHLAVRMWHPCPAAGHRDVELRRVADEAPARDVEPLRLF